MSTKTQVRAPAKVSVQRINGPGCRASLTFQFNPEELGSERSRRVWNAVADIVDAILEPGEVADFMRQFNKAVQAGK